MRDPKITIRRQTAVQLDLPETCALTLLRCAEVEKVSQHRLFRLERSIANQHHHTRVSFVDIHIGHRGRP
jgi:hypothetical protein